jgi:hypothetical protein
VFLLVYYLRTHRTAIIVYFVSFHYFDQPGSGAAALPSVAASLCQAKRVVASDSVASVVAQLRENMGRNAPSVEAQVLEWAVEGREEHSEAEQYDVILFSDAIYNERLAMPLPLREVHNASHKLHSLEGVHSSCHALSTHCCALVGLLSGHCLPRAAALRASKGTWRPVATVATRWICKGPHCRQPHSPQKTMLGV